MKRILTTTAIVLAMTGGAQAQGGDNDFGKVQVEQGDFLASNLIGMRIYNSEKEMDDDATIKAGDQKEWDDIGEINDVIVTKDGEVSAVVLGVGGFLGMGEHDVTVPMDDITIVREEGEGNDRFLVVSTSKEELKAAPEFEGKKDRAKEQKSDGDKKSDSDKKADKDKMSDEDKQANKDQKSDMDKSADKDQKSDSDKQADKNKQADNDEKANKEQQADSDKNAVEGQQVDRDVAEGQREMLTRPAVEREGYQEANMEDVRQMTSEELEGTTVYGSDDETVGEIESLVVGDDGKVEKVVVNVGGFLGIGEKPVAVTFDELQFLQESDGDDMRIYIDSTEEALENQPEYED